MTIAEEHIVGAPSLLPFFQTQTGSAYITLGAAVLAGCTVAVGFVEFLPGRVTLWALGAVGAVTVLLHTVAGHADASSPLRLVHLVEQWLHMLAVGVWIGGLVWLLLALRPKEGRDRDRTVRDFSRMAGYALGVVLLTGLLRATTEIGSLHDLFSTSYGHALLIKVALVLAIIALAALNRYRHVPALGGGAPGPARPAANGPR